MFRPPSFPKEILFDSLIVEISLHIIFENDSGFSWIIWSMEYSGVSKDKKLALGVMGTSRNPEITEMMGFRSFPSANREDTNPK